MLAGPIRFERGLAAAAVLAAHVLLAWIIIQARLQIVDRETSSEPVIASLIDQPRNVSRVVVPVEVKAEKIQHLQDLAPKIPDIPDETPVPVPNIEPVPAPAPSAEAAPLTGTGAAGAESPSSGPRGGGRQLSLVQRVVPQYPLISARRGEQGAAVMQLRVDEAGRVVEAKVARSSGSSRLDRAALDAVRKWKFAPTARGSAPSGTWGETELRFVLYRFTYSRLGARAMDGVYGEQVRTGATDEATPGSDAALKRFIADVLSGAVTGNPDPDTQREVAKLRAVLGEWGEVKSLQFTGGLAERSWVPYEIRPAFRSSQPTVEVRWDMFEVRHAHATSEWLIAVDREGAIWNAQVGPAPAQ